jgi:hypothetical protein
VIDMRCAGVYSKGSTKGKLMSHNMSKISTYDVRTSYIAHADFTAWLEDHDEKVTTAERERAINLLKTIVKEAGDAHGERQMYRADDVLECINLIQRDSMPEDSPCDCCD